ncbi:type II toxin-antitoxin system VapC family toxin [Inquilinus limosus]|uniref:type II toxin-antitoxin system VapC family toxin n=1 Tax=Inquilinus limosus TaxID=171674 RepID=UPI0004194D7B|nr:type II toxin-antitoxin system VapC family toxin [Inquilinus limosus]
MRAIDTNVLVRFLVADDKRQAERARMAFAAGDITIATTVMLESEWVLRSAYGFPPDQVADALRKLAGLPGVTLEEPALIAQALDRMVGGMDFADALHLGKASHCDAFLTFDRKLIKTAAKQPSVNIREP